jgi:hypothetical protein
MTAPVEPSNEDDEVLSKFNEIIDAVNDLGGFSVEGAPGEDGSGGRKIAIPKWRRRGLFRITSSYSKRSTGDVEDDVDSCTAKVLWLFVGANQYKPHEPTRPEILYRVGAGADLAEGDNCEAAYSEQSGRWEITGGGPSGSSSQSSDVCRMGLGGIPAWAIQGYEANKWQFLARSPGECLYWITPKPCSEPSSSSSEEESSSSSEGDGCGDCETTPSPSVNCSEFIAYANPAQVFGKGDGPIVFSPSGDDDCAWTASFPKRGLNTDPQEWRLQLAGGTTWTLICYDTTFDMTVGQWGLNSDCCTGGDMTKSGDFGPDTVALSPNCS